MWRGVPLESDSTFTEVLVRVVLLLVVCLMHVCIEPHEQHITQSELIYYYKRPRRTSIIPLWVTVLLIVFVPIIVISLPSVITGRYLDVSQSLLAWTLACSINAFITESGKLVIGRPRPDFYYRCFPNGLMTKDMQCTGTVSEVLDGKKSFPSGHSSFSFCSLGFVSFWLCGKLRILSTNRGEGLRVMTCLAPIMTASVVAMTRFCDHHHHWEDVFAGSVIGFISSYFCYRQYFYPLDSNNAGRPYTMQETPIEESHECCSNLLNPAVDIKSLNRNKYS